MSKRRFAYFRVLLISVLFILSAEQSYAAILSDKDAIALSETGTESPCQEPAELTDTDPAEYYGIGSLKTYTATGSGAETGSDADEAWYIDRNRTCSVTVHAYINQSGSESPGNWTEDQELPDGAFPLKGAVYTYWKIGELTQQVIDHTAGLYVLHVDPDFQRLLSDVSGHSIDGITVNDEICYSIADLQKAFDERVNTLTTPDSGTDFTVEDAITQLASVKGTAMQATDSEGISRAENLPQGLYILAQTGVPDSDSANILPGAAPSFLILPQSDPTKYSDDGQINDKDSLWLYDISVYPKSRMLRSGKKIILSEDRTRVADADDRETGSKVEFVSFINLPAPGTDSSYDLLNMTDTLTEGLAYIGMTGIYYGQWLAEDDLTRAGHLCQGELLPDTDYTIIKNDCGFFLQLTPEGLAKINSLNENGGIYVFYETLITCHAHIGTSGANTNECIWTVSTDHTSKNITSAPARAAVSAYGIDLLKKGLSNPSDALFEFRRDKRLLYFHQTADGIYILAGSVTAEDLTSKGSVDTTAGSELTGELTSDLSPGSDGHLLILGLDSATYTLQEIKTGIGKSLLPSPFEVTLTASPALNGSLEKAELTICGMEPVNLNLSSSNAGIANFSVSNENVITPLKAGDDDYVKVAVCIVVFGSLLLTALLVWRRRLIRHTDDTHFE